MRDLLERLAEPALIVSAAGRIEAANPAAHRLLGYERGELEGDLVELLVPRHLRARHAAHWAALASSGTRALGGGNRMDARRKDGRSVPVELSVTPLGEARAGSTLLLLHGIADRLAMEGRARLSDAVVAATANAVMVTDALGRIVLVNEAFTRMTGWAQGEVIGENPRFLGAGVHGPEVWKDLWSALHEGRIWKGELQNVRKDGTRYVAEQTITPIKNELGAVAHFVAIMQDVTMRHVEARRDARQLEQLRVLHEISRLGARATSSVAFSLGAAEIVRSRLGLSFCTLDLERTDPDGPQGIGRIERRLEFGGATLGRLIARHEGTLAPETAMLLEAVCGQLAAVLHTLTTIDGLRTRASVDALTVLANRGALVERGNLEVERAQRYGRPLSVILLDIDHFKRANDEHGHAFGDEVLRVVGNMLARERRKTDIAARYGGDELVLLLPETPIAGATAIAERVREAVRGHPWSVDGVRLTASFGVAELGEHATLAELLASADAALYQAKRDGRDRVATTLAFPRVTS